MVTHFEFKVAYSFRLQIGIEHTKPGKEKTLVKSMSLGFISLDFSPKKGSWSHPSTTRRPSGNQAYSRLSMS